MTDSKRRSRSGEGEERRSSRHARKRSKVQRENDRAQIADLSLKGMTIRSICQWIAQNRDYTLSRHAVWSDLQKVRREWKERTQISVDDFISESLARFDRVESEAWKSFEARSQQGKSADPRFLKIILSSIDARAKLLGLYSLEKPFECASEQESAIDLDHARNVLRKKFRREFEQEQNL